MTEAEQLDLLIRGLVGDEHQELFQTDAPFNTAIQTLARMLPFWVAGLVAEARRNGIVRQREYDRLVNLPPMGTRAP